MIDNRITFPVKSHGYAGEASPRERGDGAYGIKGVSIDFNGEADDHRDRDELMMWLSIFACCVGAVIVMAWMVFQ